MISAASKRRSAVAVALILSASFRTAWVTYNSGLGRPETLTDFRNESSIPCDAGFLVKIASGGQMKDIPDGQ